MDVSHEEFVPCIPKEFKEITLASVQFFRVSSPLEQLDSEDPIKKHVLLATSRGHLIELKEDEIYRHHKLEWKDVKKVLVHHEFRPPQLFIVLLRQNHHAYIASYSNFKILNEFSDIDDVSSQDSDGVGFPSLQLKHLSGNTTIIESSELSSMSSEMNGKQRPPERAKEEAASALAHRLEGGIKHVEQLNSQRCMKEGFITDKLAALQSELRGQHVMDDNTLMPVLTVEDDDLDMPQKPPIASSPVTSLEIINVRHKMVHDKWVIGLNVVNNSKRKVVCNMQLMLHVLEGTNKLSYSTKILKVIQRRSQTNSAASQIDPSAESQTKQSSINAKGTVESRIKISVEKLDPPILRPNKRACILGVCEIPDFTESSTVKCSGLVTYSCRTLSPELTQDIVPKNSSSQQFQISFEPVTANAESLRSLYVDLEKSVQQSSVPFSTVALIGGSVHNVITLTTLVSPLTDLISTLCQKHEIVKIAGVTATYCFYPEKFHPLSFAAVTFCMINSNHWDLELYSRDDSQALLLVHTILAELPSDVCVQPSQANSLNLEKDEDNTRQQLLAKMKEVATYVMDGYENQAASRKGSKAQEKDAIGSPSKALRPLQNDNVDDLVKERERFLSRKEAVAFDAKLYSEWRKKLLKIQSEMDTLYIKYLK